MKREFIALSNMYDVAVTLTTELRPITGNDVPLHRMSDYAAPF